ncbi:RNA polymerase sigma factor [Chitinophaga sp. Cy-1792]|uniref:RNA polymerase sigma factor n=1 Tax=Chitinophaga sp. Cy-1792 TaxID=2608339 RepID=UPI001421E647|nr:sigma-70 family RNA polymerase sigma factor [Chitinophaga sp. Cy-1792]NIG55504.1 sigma-70 family RNA polymerase sigma factor [Chitinophaga sp. Cy-1792]
MPIIDLPNETALLERVAAGNADAYTIIFNHYSNHVYDVAMVYLKDTYLATETVQDIFLKIWIKKEGLPGIKNFRDYLFILTRNHIYDSFKRRLTRIKVYDIHQQQQPLATADADHRLLEHEYSGILNRAVSSLPPERRKVYQARMAGFSNEEISQQLNISIHTVKKHMSLASQSVRSFVQANVNNDVLPILLLILAFRR